MKMQLAGSHATKLPIAGNSCIIKCFKSVEIEPFQECLDNMKVNGFSCSSILDVSLGKVVSMIR